MKNMGFSIALRNYAGIPVVDLVGEIDETNLASLNEILDKLAQAGHYNVMVNLKRAVWQNQTMFTSLEKIAKLFRTHYGNLDVIAEARQITGLPDDSTLARLIRFCTSEGQALTRIRRVPAPSVGGVMPMPAHLTELP